MKILLIPALLLSQSALAQARIEAPVGGWRNSAGQQEQYTQRVNYPASSVNMQDGQSASAQIRGRIAGATKGKPGTLIVNGVPMPIELDEKGHYARPYAFGRNSNSSSSTASSKAATGVPNTAVMPATAPATSSVLRSALVT